MVWDKGSSGLVFYTDASYWDEQDGGMNNSSCPLIASWKTNSTSCRGVLFCGMQILMRSVQKKMTGMLTCQPTMTMVNRVQ